MGLLDTKEYTVATVLAATAAGQITQAKYWNYSTSQYQDTAPTNVPFGQTVGACVYGQNSGAANQSMYFVLTLKRPDGTTKKTITSTAVTVTPGSLMYTEITDTSDQAGTWKVEGKLYGDVI